jgi:hypothetical protein
MFQPMSLEPVDYLMIGHLTVDLTSAGPQLGGTSTYASLTALALGLRVGIVTSWGSEVQLGPMRQIPIVSFPTEASSTFENIYSPEGRVQYIRHVAPTLNLNLIPDPWKNAPIVHLGPVAQEVEPSLVRHFPTALIGLTPQGWLRSWNSKGKVATTEWPEATFVLQHAGATVISIEDVDGDESRIEEMASSSRVLAVTEADQGVGLYWHGDIFAAAFFTRLYTTRDPWEAARFATILAACSVTRPGLAGIPTAEEIQESMVEVL